MVQITVLVAKLKDYNQSAITSTKSKRLNEDLVPVSNLIEERMFVKQEILMESVNP